jgi:hypothetical protein
MSSAPSAVDGAPRLPEYSTRDSELFDDAIEPAAVGYSLSGPMNAGRDPQLRRRTQAADYVVRVRVVTVTSNPVGDGRAWLVGLRTMDVLVGGKPAETFTLTIKDSDPAAGILKATEGKLVGSTLIAFLRQFQGLSPPRGTGGPELHFHVAGDSKEEVDRVREAALLGAVR